MSLENWLAGRAALLGFDAFGIASADAAPDAGSRLVAAIAAGRHGDMDWLADKMHLRSSPRALWPEARSVVAVGLSYAPDGDPLAALDERRHGVVSVYAKGRDYHDILKGRLKNLAGALAARTRAPLKVFVDTAPVMEKPLAQAAGLGWQGRHTNLVSREHGSWLFLGVIYTAAELAPSAPERDRCGSCRRCLDACPTNAFPAPYQLDARRCLAYLTIEHKGPIAPEFRVPLGNRVFGCDDCLAVCPWNKFARASREARFAAGPGTADPPLAELLALDDAGFRHRFAGTPVKRTGRDRFVRNACIAAGNSGDTTLAPTLAGLLGDAAPLVRGMAVWALTRLLPAGAVAALRARHEPDERDADVLDEWARASCPIDDQRD